MAGAPARAAVDRRRCGRWYAARECVHTHNHIKHLCEICAKVSAVVAAGACRTHAEVGRPVWPDAIGAQGWRHTHTPLRGAERVRLSVISGSPFAFRLPAARRRHGEFNVDLPVNGSTVVKMHRVHGFAYLNSSSPMRMCFHISSSKSLAPISGVAGYAVRRGYDLTQ